MIHICFALYDELGHYSKFTGTAILSLFENVNTPPASICIHFLHDNTLTNDNRDKFVQLVDRYGQIIKFYNVEELCTEKIKQIKEFFPNIGDDRHSIATFYRFFIPHLLPKEIEKLIYLDSDIIVNLDITEFWQIELGDKPLGAIPEFYQISDREASIELKKRSLTICGEGVVNPEDYFNAGIILMNLRVLRKEEDTISAGMEFISDHPQFTFLDQDILNYCFSTSYLKLPLKFNRFVLYAKRENEWDIQEKIYHYAASRICFVMDSRDPYNKLFMNCFIKTPWVNANTEVALSGGLPSRKNYPVSVIVPLYNEEEYIAECLDCFLAQTFQAFELIIVDDCSTDSSCAIVESYAPKFNGRLKLLRTKKNSGGGGYVPRNLGLKVANGDFVYFLDADDLLLSTALESFYAAAVFYETDVVYTSSCFFLNAPNDIAIYKDETSRKRVNINTELTIDNTIKNLDLLLPEKSTVGEFNTIFTTFCRRDFLLRNRLFFPQISRSGDFLWIVKLYCHARRFLRISTPLCLRRRYNVNSITRKLREPKEQCSFWFAGFVEFAESLYKLEKETEILAENPEYSLRILRKNLLWSLDRVDYIRDELKKFDDRELYKILRNAFANSSSPSLPLILPFLISYIDGEKNIIDNYSESINRIKPFITGRIDIKLVSRTGNGDFQILSVSDDKADVSKPDWFNRHGVGYMIQSYAGKLKIVAKTETGGKIQLMLRGRDVRDPNDVNKRIPYWIDYTKLIINGRTIFNKLTPTWHDKPYRRNMDIRAGDKITLEVEWIPHRSDIALVDDKRIDAEKKLKAEVERLLKKTTELEKTVANCMQMIRKVAPYLVARMDLKLLVKTDASAFQIISVSDDKAKVSQPDFLNKDGVGYLIFSYVGKVRLVAKTGADGQVQLILRGRDVRRPDDKSKRIPYWIDYNRLIVNGKTIFNKIIPVWHNKPYRHVLNVKAEEEIVIQVEWLPHRSDT